MHCMQGKSGPRTQRYDLVELGDQIRAGRVKCALVLFRMTVCHVIVCHVTNIGPAGTSDERESPTTPLYLFFPAPCLSTP